MPDIELSTIIEQRILDIFLNNEGSELSITISLPSFQSDVDVIHTITNCDSISSIRILARFYNPHIF